MEAKKWPGRFTVNFDLEDPEARQVADVLNQLGGHKKARFIVRAVLFYLGQATPPVTTHDRISRKPPRSSTTTQSLKTEQPSCLKQLPLSDDEKILRDAMAAFGIK